MEIFLGLNIGFIILALLYLQIEPLIKQNEKKYLCGLFIIVFSLLMAIRPINTKDTLNYINGFNKSQSISIHGINFFQKYDGFEWGYIYLNRLFRNFSDNYRLFFFLITIVGITLSVCALVYLARKAGVCEINMFSLIFSVYISYFGILYNGISVRAGLSMGLGLVALICMLDNKWIKSLVFILLAVSIQRAAFLFVVIYFIIRFFPILKMKIHLFIWFVLGIILFGGGGSRVLIFVSKILNSIIIKFHISGFGAYLAELDVGVGIRDIYLWLLYGIFIFFMCNSQYYMKYLNVILVGTLIVVFLHDIRAIARVYDMFYLFMVPILAIIYNEKSFIAMKSKRLLIVGIMYANSVIMLKLCFF